MAISQTATVHKQVIRNALQDGTLNKLYWFIEMTLPPQYGGGKAAAKYRDGVPVIPVAPDPSASREYAELLRWQFEDSNPSRSITFNLALTDASALKIAKTWYEWGDRNAPDTIDEVCHECGAVHSVLYDQLWHCCGWSHAVRAKETSMDIPAPVIERWKVNMMKYRVDAASLEDFLKRFYRPDRYTGRGAAYAAGLLASYREELQREGMTWISHHDSVTGDHVSYIPSEIVVAA